MQLYEDRNTLLRSIGYTDYAHYLGSELWKGLRAVVLAASPHCPCGRPATQVHHQDYAHATLTGEDLSTLLAVCARCHKKIELTRKGKKRSPAEVQERCDNLIREGNDPVVSSKPAKRVTKHPKRACVICGGKPKNGSCYCRPCLRESKHGKRHFDSVHLPKCKGKDCTHQAAIGKDYCRIHEVEPSLSLKAYQAFKKKARQAGIRI